MIPTFNQFPLDKNGIYLSLAQGGHEKWRLPFKLCIKKAEQSDPAFHAHGRKHGYETCRNGVTSGISSSLLLTPSDQCREAVWLMVQTFWGDGVEL